MSQQMYHAQVSARREMLEQKVDFGEYDEEYWSFVEQKGAGEIGLDKESIFKAIESGRYFDAFCDYLESKNV